jgi:hypothetical protein
MSQVNISAENTKDTAENVTAMVMLMPPYASIA